MFDNDEVEKLNDVYTKHIKQAKHDRQLCDTLLAETSANEHSQAFQKMYQALSGQPLLFPFHEVMSRHKLSRWKAYRHEA